MTTIGDYIEANKADELIGRVFERAGNPVFGYNNWRIEEVYTGEKGESRVSAAVQTYGRFVHFGDIGELEDLLDWKEVFGVKDEFDF